ncbi:hypothetical protein FISHEDRAFT_76399 [Fistulina hepatica ATCC 64428]|uniref:5-nitroimidazole antibiotic resistance protein n=1 Tax=Fistulina hepatica ATCC 64428 TaxID=1128425 RepID=A0A0D7A3D7_9AGAR|nr:hypothetical protein FISHEDRAFT_76399 [Fistulina hepatica ATCC 64428]
MATEYQQTPLNSFNRHKTRGTYDQDTIHALIDAAPVLHVSFLPAQDDADPFPVILPMIGCIGAFNPTPDAPPPAPAIYLHGHVSARLLKLNSPDGTPVCIAASSVDGLVLALTPFNHSNNYRSAVVFGRAHAVTSDAEKLWALERITDNALPGRWHQTRIPPTSAELQSTGVLRVEIVSASAKIRAKGVADVLPDLKNEVLRERVWTGVVPVWMHYGDPIPAESNMVDEVPGYIQDWVIEQNETNERYAYAAIEGGD